MVIHKVIILQLLFSLILITGCKNEREEMMVRNDTLAEVPNEDVSKIQLLRQGDYKVSVLKGDDSPIFDADLKITDIRKGEQQYNKVSGTYSVKEVYGTFKPRFPENGTFLADLDTMRSSMIIPGKSADAKDVIITFSDREEFIGGEWRIDTEADVNYTGKFKANYLIKDQN